MSCFKTIVSYFQYGGGQPVSFVVLPEKGEHEGSCVSQLSDENDQTIQSFPENQQGFCPYQHNMTTSITAGKFCLDVTQTYIFSPASARIWKSHRVKHRNIQFLMILNQIFLHYITLHGPLYHLWNTTEVKHCPFPFLLVLTDNTEKATLQDRQKYRLEPGWFHEVNATKHFCSLSHVSTLPSGTCCSVSIFFAL